jgi:hypothetical protein
LNTLVPIEPKSSKMSCLLCNILLLSDHFFYLIDNYVSQYNNKYSDIHFFVFQLKSTLTILWTNRSDTYHNLCQSEVVLNCLEAQIAL